MIRRLLIANRGEIAVRVAATARRLGISPIGVSSDPDAASHHVRAMDLVVPLGGATPTESYLRIDAVVDAALATGCDAVHPGYGFLAESAEAARRVEGAGLVWVGPTPEQIELLGDKVAAKGAAAAAGVPTTPVTPVHDGEVPADVALPALVKAAAGGGGRGMRVVRDAAELADAVAAASREAHAAFGDPTVFIEPYVEGGRHIEVQVVGDSHGNVIHLGDRDCSVQRRNQKVVEEAPAPDVDPEVRAALHDGAVALAAHVGYRGAGTVEYLVAPDGTITFLEVNTRLQVEHPVTEAVTGVDLVELQLLVAEGRPLPMGQQDIRTDGHAVEVRLVAEDPAAGWLPSSGTVEVFDPAGVLRCDAGVAAGDRVGTDYDSLLAKLVAHGPDRSTALRTLAAGLAATRFSGPATNLSMLRALVAEPDFARGPVDTGYLPAHPTVEAARLPAGDDCDATLAAAVLDDERRARRGASWEFAPPGWRNLAVSGQRSAWSGPAEEPVEVELLRDPRDPGAAVLMIGPWPRPDGDGALGDDLRRRRRVAAAWVEPSVALVDLDGITHRVEVTTTESGAVVCSGAGGTATWRPLPRFADHDTAAAGSGPVSPLPGSVLSVAVAEGDTVDTGDALVVVEAMKMEHVIRAAAPSTVSAVLVATGDRVDAGTLLVELEPTDP